MSVPKQSKNKKRKRRKKKFRPVHKEGKKGRAVSKNSKGCSTFLGWKTLDEGHIGRLLEDMCAFEPWERKSDRFLIFCFFSSFLDRPHQCPLCPPPPSPTEALAALSGMLLEPRTGGSGGWVEGGHSHTQEWNISCGFVSIHTVLIC